MTLTDMGDFDQNFPTPMELAQADRVDEVAQAILEAMNHPDKTLSNSTIIAATLMALANYVDSMFPAEALSFVRDGTLNDLENLFEFIGERQAEKRTK